jgi:hypothetical protein
MILYAVLPRMRFNSISIHPVWLEVLPLLWVQPDLY